MISVRLKIITHLLIGKERKQSEDKIVIVSMPFPRPALSTNVFLNCSLNYRRTKAVSGFDELVQHTAIHKISDYIR